VDAFDIELRGVAKVLGGRRVVDDVSLQVRRGEFFSLLGPSGCGKTTILRVLAGFESPDSGTVLLGGEDMSRVPPHRRDVNLVFQNYALFPHLNVAGNVAFGLRVQKAPEIESRVRQALERVGLGGYEKRLPTTLSGGEQQRVALARAVVPRPRVLLLDEPLGALDLKLRKQLQEELRRLQRELGMTFLHVTHDQEEALSMSDRVAVMNRGRVEQVGAPREIYERPATRFVAEFVGTANFFEGTGDGSIVWTPDGLSIAVPAKGEVTLVIRPERMRVNGGPGLAGTVEEVLFHGSSTVLLVRSGKRLLRVEDGRTDVREGEAVTLSWDPEDVLVLTQ